MHEYMLSPFSCVQLFVTSCTVACQAPLSMGFSRQEHQSGSPCPPPEDLPDPKIKPMSLALAGEFFTEPPRKPIVKRIFAKYQLGGASKL